MADYTAFVEAGNALVEMLRDQMVPEPLGERELISLCSPHESGNYQLTLYLYHIEEESPNLSSGYFQADRDTQRRSPAQYILRYLVTPHSKAPLQLREADRHRIAGAVMQILRDNPVIPGKYLSGSIAEEGAVLHVMVEKTPVEQLLKIWNNTSKEYDLSFVVMLTGVSIRSKRERQVSRVTEITIDTGDEGGRLARRGDEA